MKMGKIKGIQISLHISTLVIVLMVGYIIASLYSELTMGLAPLWQLILIGIINGFLILFAILIHELMHSLLALKYGLKISEIELYLFGGVSKIEEEPKSPGSEIYISFIGPLSSLVLGGVFFVILFIIGNLFQYFNAVVLASGLDIFILGISGTTSIFVNTTIFYFGWMNLILGLFNLIPAFPMDGGRILRAILWKLKNNHISATEIAAKVGRIFGYIFTGFGFIEIFLFGIFNGIWFIIIGLFLSDSAQREFIQTVIQVRLSKVTSRELLSHFEIIIPYDMPLSELMREYFMKYKRSYFPVEQDGTLIGLIHISDINKVPIEKRNEIKAISLVKDIKEFPTIKLDSTGLEVFKRMQKTTSLPRIVIVKSDDDNILGFIGEHELEYVLRFS